MSAELVAKLIAAGTPAALVAEVAMALGRAEADRTAISERRAADAARKAKQRGVKSRDITGQHVTPVTARDDLEKTEPARDAHTHEGAPAGQITTNTTTKNIKTPPSEGQKTKREPNPRTRIASDAQPSEKDREIASDAGMDRPTFRNEWGLFRDHHIAEGSTMADWSAAWRTWVGKWVRHGSKPVRPANSVRAGPRDPNQIIDPMTNAADRYLQQLHS